MAFLGWAFYPCWIFFPPKPLWQPFKTGGLPVIHVLCIQKEALKKRRGKKDDKYSATASEYEFMCVCACQQFYYIRKHKQLASGARCHLSVI